jgi:O-antigen/teichoic acid export membrane protein
MKVYAINENEVTTISSLNTQATIFFSLASFLASACIGIYTNAIFYTELTAAGQVAKYFVVPILAVLTLTFVALGVMMMRQRQKLWREVKKESESV